MNRVTAAVLASAFAWGAPAILPAVAASQASGAAESGYAEVQGGRIWYEVAGFGDALVLVHGNAGDHRHWDHQLAPLARKYRVIRYDVRGYGRSTVPTEEHPYADHEDLVALLDHLGVPQAHIAGWSMGCGIAVDFAIAYPERTTSLIAIGPWVSGYTSAAAEELFADFGGVVAAASENSQAAVKAWMRAPFFASTIRDPAAGAEFARIASDYSWWHFTHPDPRRSLEPPALGRVGAISVPALVVTGEHDIPACREIAALLESSVPNSRLVDMVNTGHLVHMEKPEEFNKALIGFLESHPGNR